MSKNGEELRWALAKFRGAIARVAWTLPSPARARRASPLPGQTGRGILEEGRSEKLLRRFGVEFQEFERHFGGADHVVDVEPFAHGVNIAHPGAEIRDGEAAMIQDVGVASAARRFGLDC